MSLDFVDGVVAVFLITCQVSFQQVSNFEILLADLRTVYHFFTLFHSISALSTLGKDPTARFTVRLSIPTELS